MLGPKPVGIVHQYISHIWKLGSENFLDESCSSARVLWPVKFLNSLNFSDASKLVCNFCVHPWLVYTSLAQAGEGAEACVVSIVAGSFECTISHLAIWISISISQNRHRLVESISRVAEDTLPTPPLGTSSVAADTALHLPAAQPPAHPFISTSDTTAGTSPQLPAVLPPTLLS
ncbi:hypothetical protein Prudu_1120S000300 [Prunus dulcis]|uniref:Uncharacterized protein n=1 Tax=Prunus dulcis TaxID=3755 RepID=A0A5H2Y2G2_PRUDU|nr:hypothetical protein Prudu_1120S000300 [Prunus dulcis]